MRTRFIHLVGVIALVACASLTLLWAASYVGRMQRDFKFPGGLALSTRGRGSDLRLTATRWGAESKEWWRARAGTGPMTVTGQTITISGTTLYATQINVDFGSSEWHGVRWHAGATSRAPLTTSTGVMSTPLVPYRSASVPWFYPLFVLAPIVTLWIIFVARRRRRRRVGHCVVCGYDLRATPERCPECGSVLGKIENVEITTPRSPGAA